MYDTGNVAVSALENLAESSLRIAEKARPDSSPPHGFG
jgi:hypothetical protein